MSNTPSPGTTLSTTLGATLLNEDDPVVLNSHLDRLVAEYAQLKIELAKAKAANDEPLIAALSESAKLMVHDQIAIISKLRRTSSGPAKAGGKRAKKAPLDLAAALANLMKKPDAGVQP